MSPIVPPRVPSISRDQAAAFLADAGLPTIDKAVLLGRRGFFVTMGVTGNDFGVYDDGIVLISPTALVTYNANTDPSIKRPRVAVLQPGRWTYELGIHNRMKPVEKRYRALVQAAEVVVHRPGTESMTAGTNATALGRCLGDGQWRGWFGINIHRGGLNSTSSEGCQTIYKPQYDAFLAQTEMEMTRYGQQRIDYFLTQEA